MLRDELGRAARTFTLQWHLTNACELACAHCYDRSKNAVLPFGQALAIVDSLEAFCAAHEVSASVILSGGNPIFYPWFFELYEELHRRGIALAILGNPIPEATLARIVRIALPRYYQVSLEGLPPHDDRVRGAGHFASVLPFLDTLRAAGVRASVMTTLTADNLEQVIPLARMLDGKVSSMTWNRLCQTGNGADLQLPERERYGEFLVEYLAARRQLPFLRLKDNLFNILLHELGRPLSGGCTGFGCGAAFNFFALLPTGEAHACRKYPSPIGSATESTIEEIYFGERAARYRRGSSACAGCPIRAQCGGCPGVVQCRGGDPFTDLDPYCFMFD
jgi:selenobiotic family peptide radical SAM maturase